MTLRDEPGRNKVTRLGSIVQQEARRFLSEARIRPDPARLAQGWERRFITDGHRAEELMELYRKLGYEVCADPVRREDLNGECEDCELAMLLHFKTIYTRKERT